MTMPFHHHVNANAALPRAPRRPREATRANWVRGTLVELDPDGVLTIRVHEVSRAHLSPGRELRIDAGSARVRATDGDGDGRPGLTDLFPGDELEITLRWPPRRTMPAARWVLQRSVGAPAGGLRPPWSTSDW